MPTRKFKRAPNLAKGTHVAVSYNRTLDCWSVRCAATGKLLCHRRKLLLAGACPAINDDRLRLWHKTGRRNFHAALVGALWPLNGHLTPEERKDLWAVDYDSTRGRFYLRVRGRPTLQRATYAALTPDGVFVKAARTKNGALYLSPGAPDLS